MIRSSSHNRGPNEPSIAVAEFAAKEAERSLRDIEDALSYQIKARYPLILFNSHNGFSVSNISSPSENSHPESA